MKPEIYKWLTYICSTYNEEIGEYDAELTNSQVLYIVLCYFFLMDEEDLHIADLAERWGLEGVVSALKTEVKLVTVSPNVKYLFIENPKNCYESMDDITYRLTFVKLVKAKNGEWGRNVFGTTYRDLPSLWQLDDNYKTEEELISLLNNMNLEVSWHCDSLEPSESESAVSLAHSLSISVTSRVVQKVTKRVLTQVTLENITCIPYKLYVTQQSFSTTLLTSSRKLTLFLITSLFSTLKMASTWECRLLLLIGS